MLRANLIQVCKMKIPTNIDRDDSDKFFLASDDRRGHKFKLYNRRVNLDVEKVSNYTVL